MKVLISNSQLGPWCSHSGIGSLVNLDGENSET